MRSVWSPGGVQTGRWQKQRPSPFSSRENDGIQGVDSDVPSTGDERTGGFRGSSARAGDGVATSPGCMPRPRHGLQVGELAPSRVARAGDVWEPPVTTPYKSGRQNDRSRSDKPSR